MEIIAINNTFSMNRNAFFLITLLILSMIGCNSSDQEADAYGNFEAVEVFVSALGNGKVEQLNLQEGDLLREDQLLGYIDTVPQYLNLKQVLAQKKSMQAKTEAVKSQTTVLETEKKTLLVELNRTRSLFDQGAATKAQLDNITGKFEVLEQRIRSAGKEVNTLHAEIQTINAKIDLIKEQLDQQYIINPINGTVLEKYVEPGEVIMMGKPLYKIADLSTLELKAYISGTQLSSVKIGQEVMVRIDAGVDSYHDFKGRVSWISPESEFTPKIIQTKAERVNLVYAIMVKVDNDGSIKIGMPGEVVF